MNELVIYGMMAINTVFMGLIYFALKKLIDGIRINFNNNVITVNLSVNEKKKEGKRR
jgi:hypothetical protein